MLIPLDQFHEAEIRDEYDNIVIEGVYSQLGSLTNYNHTGILDFITINLHYLNDKLENGGVGDVTGTELEQKLAELRSYINDHNVEIGDRLADIQNSMEDKDSEEVKRLEAQIEDLNSQIDIFIRNTNSQINDTNANIETRLEIMNNKVNTVQSTVDSRLNATMDALNKEIKDLTNDDGTGKLDTMLAVIASDLAKTVADTEKKLTDTNERITTQLVDIRTTVTDTVNTLSGKTDQLVKDMTDQMNATNRELNAQMTNVRNEFNDKVALFEQNVQDVIDDTNKRVTELSTDVSDFKEYAENKLSASEKYVDDTIADLNTQVTTTAANLRREMNEVSDRVENRLAEAEASIHYNINAAENELNDHIQSTKTELNDKINETSAGLNNRVDNIQADYTEKIGTLGETLSGNIDKVEQDVNDKIDDLASRVHDTVQDVSTVQGILGAAMSGSDSIAEVASRGDSLQIIAGKNNVTTLSPSSVTTRENYCEYLFVVEPGIKYGIATRMSSDIVPNYVFDSNGNGLLGENGLLSSNLNEYETGYIVGDSITIPENVRAITVRSYSDPIKLDREMVAIANISEMANSYISQVNLGNGVIQLAGKLIQINGDTVFSDDAIIKGTMTTGKVEIGDSGVKLDENGLSVKLENGSRIVYDSTGQHFVDSQNHTFTGIGRFMVGHCIDNQQVTFETAWDIIPNIIMIPQQYELVRGAGTDYIANAYLKCFPTDITREGFKARVYTAISEYNYPLRTPELIADELSKTYTTAARFNSDSADGVFSTFVDYKKADDITSLFSGTVKYRHRAVITDSINGYIRGMCKSFTDCKMGFELTGSFRETLKYALTNNIDIGQVVFPQYDYSTNLISLAKKYHAANKDLFEQLDHTEVLSDDCYIRVIWVDDATDIWLSKPLGTAEAKVYADALYSFVGPVGMLSTYRYIAYVLPEEGLQSKNDEPVYLGTLRDIMPGETFTFKRAAQRDVWGFLASLRGTGKQFTLFRGHDFNSGKEGLTEAKEIYTPINQQLANKTQFFNDNRWYDDAFRMHTYKYSTISSFACMAADLTNDLYTNYLLSPNIEYTAYEKYAARKIYDLINQQEESYSNYNLQYQVELKTEHKQNATDIEFWIDQTSNTGQKATSEIVKIPVRNSYWNTDYIENSESVQLELPQKEWQGTVRCNFRVHYKELDQPPNYQDNLMIYDFDRSKLPSSYPAEYELLGTRNVIHALPNNDLNFTIGDVRYPAGKLNFYVYRNHNGSSEKTYIVHNGLNRTSATVKAVVDIGQLEMIGANLETPVDTAGYKSGTAVFIATDATYGGISSAEDFEYWQRRLMDAQKTNTDLQESLAPLAEKNASLTAQISGLNSQIATYNIQNNNLTNENANIENQIPGLRTQANNLAAEVKVLTDENDNLQNQKTGLNNDISVISSRIGDKQAQVEYYQSIQHRYDDEIEPLLVEILGES